MDLLDDQRRKNMQGTEKGKICRLGLPELAESVTALTYVNAKGDVRRLTNKHEVSFPLGVI